MVRLIGSSGLMVLVLIACASSHIAGPAAIAQEIRLEEADLILPVRIMHNSEQIWDGDRLVQDYNYLVYEFETEAYLYRARAYLDNIQAVSILGIFDKYSKEPLRPTDLEIDPRVLAYLRRRYVEIDMLGPTGYVPIEE
ncbi:hypothetical protein [Hyphomonas sp.]|uniref:hypothetical protein n=2 Tax=Hyphomonas sp. TaxID=87 RepID=UPI000C597E6C|nr:hypothetical protein [Hyphomonas sp.]MAB09924.1 hypothetical protein [Hyphomonas sp.]MAU65513.1 hypothetical protein [Hyphomonas sp.]MBM59369.1 hypothetical protein [Hyphomonas sp.]